MDFIDRLLGKKLSKEEFDNLLGKGAIIVDVRSPVEFKAEGHLTGALNIPLQFIIQKADFLKQQNKPVITVCRHGVRSSMAVALLNNAGVDACNGGSWSSLE